MKINKNRSLLGRFAIAAIALSAIGCSTAAVAASTPAPTSAAAQPASKTVVAATAAAQTAVPTHDHTAAAATASEASATPTTAATAQPATVTTAPATFAPTLAPTVAPTVAATIAPVQSGPVLVTLVDTAIRLDRTSTGAGTVSFQIRNAGSVAHELIVLKTNIPQNQIPVSTTQAATVTVPGLVAQTQILNPGASTTLTLNLASGAYVLMCNQPAHYLIGMHTGFTIN